jgi:hypothetical protein
VNLSRNQTGEYVIVHADGTETTHQGDLPIDWEFPLTLTALAALSYGFGRACRYVLSGY